MVAILSQPQSVNESLRAHSLEYMGDIQLVAGLPSHGVHQRHAPGTHHGNLTDDTCNGGNRALIQYKDAVLPV